MSSQHGLFAKLIGSNSLAKLRSSNEDKSRHIFFKVSHSCINL